MSWVWSMAKFCFAHRTAFSACVTAVTLAYDYHKTSRKLEQVREEGGQAAADAYIANLSPVFDSALDFFGFLSLSNFIFSKSKAQSPITWLLLAVGVPLTGLPTILIYLPLSAILRVLDKIIAIDAELRMARQIIAGNLVHDQAFNVTMVTPNVPETA